MQTELFEEEIAAANSAENQENQIVEPLSEEESTHIYTKLQDFGEYIPGARKEFYQNKNTASSLEQTSDNASELNQEQQQSHSVAYQRAVERAKHYAEQSTLDNGENDLAQSEYKITNKQSNPYPNDPYYPDIEDIFDKNWPFDAIEQIEDIGDAAFAFALRSQLRSDLIAHAQDDYQAKHLSKDRNNNAPVLTEKRIKQEINKFKYIAEDDLPFKDEDTIKEIIKFRDKYYSSNLIKTYGYEWARADLLDLTSTKSWLSKVPRDLWSLVDEVSKFGCVFKDENDVTNSLIFDSNENSLTKASIFVSFINDLTFKKELEIEQRFNQFWLQEFIDREQDKLSAAYAHILREETLGSILERPDLNSTERLLIEQQGFKVNEEVLSYLKSNDHRKLEQYLIETFRAIQNTELPYVIAHTIATIQTDKLMYKAELLNNLERSDWSKVGAVHLNRNEVEVNEQNVSLDKISPQATAKNIVDFLSTQENENIRKNTNKLTKEQQTKITEQKQSKLSSKYKFYAQTDVFGITHIYAEKDKSNTPLISFNIANAKDVAHEYIANNQINLVTLYKNNLAQNKVTEQDIRKEFSTERVGRNYRNDKNIDEQTFAQTFNFRAVQFGNWVTQKERQKFINNTYDALMDLSHVLESPPQALGLDGNLAISFGARGTGGINAAAAHFESSKVVINLTKKQGAGCLAHEWFHALDNHLAKQATNTKEPKDIFLSDFAAAVNQQTDPNLDNKVQGAMANLVEKLEQSSMFNRVQNLDANSARTKPYWSDKREMAARAFENYVIATLADKDRHNDFLANVRDEQQFGKSKDKYPYLTAEELPIIKSAFNELANNLEASDLANKVVIIDNLEQKELNSNSDIQDLSAKQKTDIYSLMNKTFIGLQEEAKSEIFSQKFQVQATKISRKDEVKESKNIDGLKPSPSEQLSKDKSVIKTPERVKQLWLDRETSAGISFNSKERTKSSALER